MLPQSPRRKKLPKDEIGEGKSEERACGGGIWL